MKSKSEFKPTLLALAEAERCKSVKFCENGNSNKSAFLLNLPSLVIDQILYYLTDSDILTLRLTCKATKFWVEQNISDKVGITVKSKEIFVSLLKSETPWTNFTFHWKMAPTLKQMAKFTLIYFDQIRTLQFKCTVYDAGVIKLICSCTNLRTLIINEVDGTTLAELSAKEKARFAAACSKLEYLAIQDILSDDKKGAEFFTKQILPACCSSLKLLVVPFLTFSPISAYPIKYAWDKTTGMTDTTATDVLIVRPMIEILDVREKAPYLESIIVVPESRSSFSDSSLFCLTLLCYHRKINLVYDKLCDTSLNLGKLNYRLSTNSSMHMSEIASKIMISMSSTTDLILNYQFMNLRKLAVQFSTFHIDQDVFVVQNFPRLNTLSFDFKIRKQVHPRCSKVKRMDMFFQSMLDLPRPSVKHLKIQNHQGVDKIILLKMPKMVNCFPNLRSLILINYGGEGSDFAKVWVSLTLLETVELETCPGMNDKGILGDNWLNPAILQLKELRDLKITKCGRITDLSYIICISQMRLIKFYHEPQYQADVTFEGYNSLADGDFAKNVKFFDGTATYFGKTSKRELLEYLNKFQFLQESQRRTILHRFKKSRKLSAIL